MFKSEVKRCVPQEFIKLFQSDPAA